MKKIKLLFIFLNIILLNSLTFAQELSTGTITSIYQDYGEIIINDKEYSFNGRELKITYEDRNFSIVALQVGIRVRFKANRDNEITEITLLGPDNVLQELLDR